MEGQGKERGRRKRRGGEGGRVAPERGEREDQEREFGRKLTP